MQLTLPSFESKFKLGVPCIGSPSIWLRLALYAWKNDILRTKTICPVSSPFIGCFHKMIKSVDSLSTIIKEF